METVRDLEVIEEQLIKAKKVLDESQAMVKKMQDIVFCMEVEAQELKEEIEFRQNILESEIHQ
jgi:anaerobic ribonucleoside-triphosphate reductase|tara:strand:- start:1993 stop:2181 length:189 start_codon:yes stop_codon:yes gene_type:complete